MKLDVEYAVKYMFKDRLWKKKFLISWLFMFGMVLSNFMSNISNSVSNLKAEQIKPYLHLLPSFLVCFIVLFLLVLLLSCFSSGYFSKNINLRIFKPDSDLLDWDNWKDLFNVGFKASVAIGLYGFVGILIVSVLAFLLVVAATFFISAGVNKLAIYFCVFLFVFFASLVLIAFLAYIVAASLAFCTDLKFSSFFNFSLINKFITKNFCSFLVYLLMVFAVSVVIYIVNSLLLITIVGALLMPFTFFYQFLVQNELAAQFVRNTLDLPIHDKPL